VAKRYILQQKVSEWTDRNLPARNTLVQLLDLYTDRESHNAQRYRQTDRQTDGRHDDANNGSYCAEVQSAKNSSRTSIAGCKGGEGEGRQEMEKGGKGGDLERREWKGSEWVHGGL